MAARLGLGWGLLEGTEDGMELGGATWGIQRFTSDRPCKAGGTTGDGLESTLSSQVESRDA